MKIILLIYLLLISQLSFCQDASKCIYIKILNYNHKIGKLKTDLFKGEDDIQFVIANKCLDTFYFNLENHWKPRLNIIWFKVNEHGNNDTLSIHKILSKSDIQIMNFENDTLYSVLNRKEKISKFSLIGLTQRVKKGKYRVKISYRISNLNEADKLIESEWIEIFYKHDYK